MRRTQNLGGAVNFAEMEGNTSELDFPQRLTVLVKQPDGGHSIMFLLTPYCLLLMSLLWFKLNTC